MASKEQIQQVRSLLCDPQTVRILKNGLKFESQGWISLVKVLVVVEST